MPQAGLGGLSSPRADKVQEEFQVHPCLMARLPFHRARCRFRVFQFGCGCYVACPKGELCVLPSERRVAAYGGFFRDENINILGARSIMYAVRYAASSYPPGRLLILSDNLALVPVLCNGRTNNLHCCQKCVESLRLVSGQVLSYLSGGYRQS